MTAPVTFTLSAPLILPSGEKVASLTLRRMKAGEMRTLDVNSGGMGFPLACVAAINAMPVAALDDMDGGDLLALMEAFAPFLERPAAALPMPSVSAPS